MELQNIKDHLAVLISEGHRWQYLTIKKQLPKPKFYFSAIQFIFLSIALLGSLLLSNGFPKDFIGYVMASLSIFIGLFMTLILAVFDKFQKLVVKNEPRTQRVKIFIVQRKNFFKQFTALTSYAILISIFSVFILSLSLLSGFFDFNVFSYEFISSFSELSCQVVLNFIKGSFIILYRIILIYFLLDFFLITIYALSSIYNYIMLAYDEEKII